jgi:hypothetical protein
VSEVNNYISNGISFVFSQSPEDLTIANSYLSKYTDQIYLLISNLNGLCDCDFVTEAKLQGIKPSQPVVNSIYSAFIDAGVEVPIDILLQYQSDTIGVLGSFYSCVSEDDPNPILVATGSYEDFGYKLAKIQCNKWSMNNFIRVNETIYTDDLVNGTSYFSVTGEPPCLTFMPPTLIGYGYGICMYTLYNELPS